MYLWSPRFLALLLDLRQHVGLAEDEEVLAVDDDLGAAVLAVEDLVPSATSSGTRCRSPH